MTERKPEEIRKAIDGELSGVGRDPFLYQRVLNMGREEPSPNHRRPRRLTVALVVLLVLTLSTAVAVATNWTSVRWFLTDRLYTPLDVQDAYIVHPTAQSFDSDRINLTVLDAYWYEDYYGDRLALTMHAEAKAPDTPFCMEIDIGNDGESFDMIWWHGEIIPVTQWLNGRDGYVMETNTATWIGNRGYSGNWDYIQEETGLTIMMQLWDVPDISDGVTLGAQIRVWPIRPSSDAELGFRQYWDDVETTILTVTLPPMRCGPAREIDWANEPNA